MLKFEVGRGNFYTDAQKAMEAYEKADPKYTRKIPGINVYADGGRGPFEYIETEYPLSEKDNVAILKAYKSCDEDIGEYRRRCGTFYLRGESTID